MDDPMPICRKSAWGQSRRFDRAGLTSALPPKSGNEADQLIKRSKLVTKRRLSAVLDADRYLSPHRYSMMPKSGSRRYSMKAQPRFRAGLIESAHAFDGLSASGSR
jgi:hypothetical protein